MCLSASRRQPPLIDSSIVINIHFYVSHVSSGNPFFFVTDEYKARVWCFNLKWRNKSKFTPASKTGPVRLITWLSRNISLEAVWLLIHSVERSIFSRRLGLTLNCFSPFVHQLPSVRFLPLLVIWVSTFTPALHHLSSLRLYSIIISLLQTLNCLSVFALLHLFVKYFFQLKDK